MSSTMNSPGLSLALNTSYGGIIRVDVGFHDGRSREEEYENRSGSDNMDGGSGDDMDDSKLTRKRYHRHSPQQIQELETVFMECPHPDEKQRMELGRKLNLESRQIKFWFQNRRTQMKTQLEKYENTMLRQENDKLRVENILIRDAIKNPICMTCGKPTVLDELSLEQQHVRIENARLKDELERILAISSKFFGYPISSVSSILAPASSAEDLDSASKDVMAQSQILSLPASEPNEAVETEKSLERAMLLELALSAMDELVKMAQMDEPVWVHTFEGRQELNHEEYLKVFPRCIGEKPIGFVTDVTRETQNVFLSNLALVETLMDSQCWAEMFPNVVTKAVTTDIISSGVGDTKNGALQLMHAELQVLSPLVPMREVNFLRFCKQHAGGMWAIVDVSIDTIKRSPSSTSYVSCRRLPSGCIIQELPNGFSKVTWVEHSEYDESLVHRLYRSILASGLCFGAQRWLSILQRQCEFQSTLTTAISTRDHAEISTEGKRNMAKLAQRMTSNFCEGLCGKVQKWSKLNAGNGEENIRIMSRKNVDYVGEPLGIILNAATSIFIPVEPLRLFVFLCNEERRNDWDILFSNGGSMQEIAHIPKGQDRVNCISLLCTTAMKNNQESVLILQEAFIDAGGGTVVYSPVDIPKIHAIMKGREDPSRVTILPSGIAILPDCGECAGQGSLLTIAFQILINRIPSAKISLESMETVSNLISCTVQKIKAAFNCEL